MTLNAYLCAAPMRSAPHSGRARNFSIFVSSAALMVGLLSSGAQAQNCPGATELLPFGQGGGLNALTSAITTANTAFLTNSSAFVSAPGDPQPDQFAGGVWARSIAGTVETKADSTINATFSAPLWGHCSGTANTQTKINNDYWGFQAGRDIGVLNDSIFGGNWHYGTTVGYLGSKANEEGGSFQSTFDVPFVGIYGAFSKGNFLADAQVQWTYYQSTLNDPASNGIFNQRLDANSVTGIFNAGYRFDLADRWFVEPSVGGSFSRISVDPLDISGTAVLLQGGKSWPGSVHINDFDSDLGRASVRVGTTVNSFDGSVVAQPYFTASVYREFAGNVTASIESNPEWANLFSTSGSISTNRIGTYAQFGVGSAFQFVNTGWLGYVRFDYRTGDNIEGFGFNAGVRYQLDNEPHGLKDGGSLKDAPVAVAYNWTGLYAGPSFGGTWGEQDWRVPGSNGVKPDFAGYLVGGQLGYNYQFDRYVIGVEGDFGSSNAGGAKSCPNKEIFSCEAGADEIGSVTARLGYAWGRLLAYAKGGWAFGDVAAGAHNNTGPYPIFGLLPERGVSSSKWADGWTIGGGAELALSEKWSAKAEYMYYDLDDNVFVVGRDPVSGSVTSAPNVPTKGDIIRVGLNYHLNLAPESYK